MAAYSEIQRFIERQQERWSLAADNFSNLRKMERKPFQTGLMEGYVQFNPARAISNSAKVDPESIKKRKCFLCKDNRPAEQMEIEIFSGWTLLINPFPILRDHLTIVSDRHIPQEFPVSDAIELTRLLPGMTLFYNAAGAGASAPDHRHFQAVGEGELPLVDLVERNFSEIKEKGCGVLRLPFLIETGEISDNNAEGLEESLEKFREAPINVFLWNTGGGNIRYIVIPRRAHRPDCFFRDGDQRRAVSPGAIDMAGIIVTPYLQDFLLITDEEIEDIYRQVGYEPVDQRIGNPEGEIE